MGIYRDGISIRVRFSIVRIRVSIGFGIEGFNRRIKEYMGVMWE
jgi:hypothetical protein